MRSDQRELFEQWKDFKICFEIKPTKTLEMCV